MRYRHVVVTLFSLRDFHRLRGMRMPATDAKDPLDPARLDHRLRLLEIVTLPSLLHQTDQRFEWVVLIDPALPATYRHRLADLIARRPDSRLLTQDRSLRLLSLDWLVSPDGDETVITTNLDDDDGLPATFVQAVHDHVDAFESRARAESWHAPLGIVGFGDMLQWDLVVSPEAPFGWRAPWHRETACSNAGLTLFCRSPAVRLNVLGLRHRLAQAYFDFSIPLADEAATSLRQALLQGRTAVESSGRPDGLFVDISDRVGPVLVTNHFTNDQVTRLREFKPGRRAAVPEDFKAFSVDWDAYRRLSAFFRTGQGSGAGAVPSRGSYG